jgi:hypothetical protein
MQYSDEQLAARDAMDLDDAHLLAQCRMDFVRVRGPGGQHRNKADSGVRLVHEASGITVTATERRSQHANRAVALERLRQAIATKCRRPLPEKIEWPCPEWVSAGRLKVSARHELCHQAIALVLDALAAHDGQLRPAAEALGVTSSSMASLLAEHRDAWTESNRLRASFDLPRLQKR